MGSPLRDMEGNLVFEIDPHLDREVLERIGK